MKKPIHFLLIFLFLACFSFAAKAQDKYALGQQLYAAVSDQNTAAAMSLIQRGANLDYQTGDFTTLKKAVYTDNFAVVEAMLKAGANVNFVDSASNFSSLYTAVCRFTPSIEIVKLLLSYKAEVNVRDPDGSNSLHKNASCNGNTEVASLLLDAGADPNALDNASKTPRDVAVIYNRKELAALLAKVMKPSVKEDGKELFELVKMSYVAGITELIKRGTNLNYGTGGDSTLTLAIRNRRADIAKMLLEAGADPNFAEPKYGLSALGMAAQMSDAEMVELLINKYKADVNHKTKSGTSILHTAADANSDEKIIAMLLAAGANPNVINNDGQSPLERAASGTGVYRGSRTVVNLLTTVTKTDEIARLKKAWDALPKAPKPVQTVAVAPTPAPTPKKQTDPDVDDPDEIAALSRDAIARAQRGGFTFLSEGKAARQDRNGNSTSLGVEKAVFPGTQYQFVMISKDALAVNAVMNGTLLRQDCDNCSTSISKYATSVRRSEPDANGYYMISFQFKLLNFQNNYVSFIMKGNKSGENVKWLFFSMPDKRQ